MVFKKCMSLFTALLFVFCSVMNTVGVATQTAYAASVGSSAQRNALPASYDSRLNGIQTRVRTQGVTSACWAIAALDVIEQNMSKQNLPFEPFAPAHLTWFAHRSLVFAANRDAGDGTSVANPYMHGGNWIDAAAALSRGNGPVFEKDFPFYPSLVGSMGHYSESDRYKREANLTSAVCYYSKDNFTPAHLSSPQMKAIKQAIMQNGAVQLSFYSDVLQYVSSGQGTFYYQNENYATNHAVVVIGWDDSVSANAFSASCRPQNNGAWICKNSWGDEWGDDGCFYLSYEEVSLNQIVGYTATAEWHYEDIYQYDGFGFHGRVFSDSYVRFVNVYTADEACEIAAVGTWFLQDNSDYTAEVFRLDDGLQASHDVLSRVSASGTVPYYGYYVVKLDDTLWLQKGDIFAVCVTLTADAECPQVNAPIENVSADDYVCYSESGQSFVQIVKNGPWYDTSKEGLNNVCLKALTAHRHNVQSGNTCSECGAVVEMRNDLFVKIITRLFALLIRMFESFMIRK